MRVRLICESVEAPVSPFVARFISGVCIAVAASLKTPAAARIVEFELHGEEVGLQIDGYVIPLGLNQGFAETLVRDTLSGMIRSLKGVDPRRNIRIVVDLVSTS
jgi:hypothetical protein